MDQQHFQHSQLESYLGPETPSGSMAAGEPERELVYDDVITQDGEKEAERLIMEAKRWSSAGYPSNPAELMQVQAVSFYKEFGGTQLAAQQLPSYTDLETVAIQHNLNNGDCAPPEDQRIIYDSSITSDEPSVPYIREQQDSRQDRHYHHKEVHRVDQTLHSDHVGNKKEEKLCCINKPKDGEADIEDTSLETECVKDSSETDIEGSNEDQHPQTKAKGKNIKLRVPKITETWEGDILDRGRRRSIQDRRSPRLSGKNKFVTVQTMGEIVLPANCKSPVWEYFSFQVSDVEGGQKMVSKNVSVCRLCKTHVRCMGNTTNMATHLKRHHPEIELFDGKEKDKKQMASKSASKLVKRKTSPAPVSPPSPLPPQEKQEKKPKKGQPPHKNSLSDLSMDGDVFDRWWRLGTERGLDSDKDIASFLLHHYENSMKSVQSASCRSCQAPITMLCAKCLLTFEAMPSQPIKAEEEKGKDGTESSDHEIAEIPDDPEVSADEIPVKFEERGTHRSSLLVRKPILLHSISKRKFRKRPMHHRESVKVYRCGQCVAVFKHPKSLENHLQTHNGDRPFKCQECETAFKRSSDLAVHMRTHTGERPYKCDLCESAFTQSCALSRHIRTHPGAVPVRRRKLKSTLAQVHVKGVSRGPKPKGPKVYNCDQCWKSFQSSSNLKVHMRIHTGERPYTCEVCGATFTQSSALSLHKRTHQMERPFKCDQCDGSFKRSSDLAIHMRTHTGERPYVCELCGSAFAQLSTLTIHRSSHSDNKPYKCQECGMMFKLTSHLQRHLKTHVGHVPCDQCGAMFKSPVALARHVRKHMGPDAVLLPADRYVNIENL